MARQNLMANRGQMPGVMQPRKKKNRFFTGTGYQT
jgi:hypothetical protein